MELMIDEARHEQRYIDNTSTRIYVRAKHESGRWESVDILCLTKESLLEWLKSRGGDNPYAEDVVGMLLGHGRLHP
jgi:hypothetical protein